MDLDIDIDIECRKCGLLFKQGFRSMPHGKPLSCPFCSSVQLDLKGQSMTEQEAEADMFEQSFEERLVKRKIKL
ncbi:MAG: hypothetical protein HY954_01335 [Deltaproteobacteria bacterium]|nr:hypothetical protein [Deltaproteobacteria bacterium]